MRKAMRLSYTVPTMFPQGPASPRGALPLSYGGGSRLGRMGAAAAVNPATGLQIDPATGWDIDPASGWDIDPSTGMIVDPNTGAESAIASPSALKNPLWWGVLGVAAFIYFQKK